MRAVLQLKLAAALALTLGSAFSTIAHDDMVVRGETEESDTPLAASVRQANARFQQVASAKAEGYEAIPCASSPNGGAMGIHFVNAAYLKDDLVEIARPEAVMYEPASDGSLKLVAVEYITSKGPASLDGQLFNFNSAPNRYGLGPFYELHVWAWRRNPTGTFADNNPRVSCEAARGAAKLATVPAIA
jgi:hypothetical protein